MDELLALMDEECASPAAAAAATSETNAPRATEASGGDGGLDELADLLEGPRETASSSATDTQLPAYTRHSNSIATKRKKPSTTTGERRPASNSYSSSSSSSSTTPRPRTSAPPVVTVGVDEKVGIRMTDRKVSSLDLLDVVTMNPYQSPAQISALSLQGLCRLLVDPPSIVDQATVQGKTHLCTVGIVLEHSGTKTSSNSGSCFCVLTIGTLASGPCLSIFLFGAAYTQYCRGCRAGQVVAVLNPKLLPLRDGNQTARMSVSVQDPSQLMHVGKARDFGTCKATVKARQSDGSWRSNAGHCKNFVDTRQGDYCKTHGKQQRQSQSAMRVGGSAATATVGQSKGGNLIQQMKTDRHAQHHPHQQHHQHQHQQQTQGSRPQLGGNRFLTTNTGDVHQSRFSNAVTAAIPKHMKQTPKQTPKQMQMQMQMQKQAPGGPPPRPSSLNTILVSKSKPSNGLLNGSRRNALSKQALAQHRQANAQTQQQQQQQQTQKSKNKNKKLGIVGQTDWMTEAVARRRPATTSLAQYARKACSKRVSTSGGGFDGSVAVPKPSQTLFAGRAPTISRTSTASATLPEPAVEQIKHQQARLAQQVLRLGQGTKPTKKNHVKSKSSSSSSSNSFLDSIQVDDVQAVLNAKSRFASDADAEEYARNRQRVEELEKLEFKQSKRPNKEKENTQRLAKVWVCQTCKGKFSTVPRRCIAAGHTVKTLRTLKEGSTKEDERTKMHRKDAEEGGLVLSRGLDWSQNRKDAFS